MEKINKFNQYLLEKYPTVWNTKLVWMLLVAFAIHVIFFFIGYFSHTYPISLHGENALQDYFKDGVIYIHVIISVLLIVAWLILMFRNNAFKNFYPSSKWKLFSQFLHYFVIILASTTFYFSYMYGFKLFINQRYDDKTMEKNVEIINKTAPFLSQNLELYTLANRKFPKEFADLYCEKEFDLVDKSKPFFVYHDRIYQYFTTYSKTVYKKDKYGDFDAPEPEKSQKVKPAYADRKPNSMTFYYKKDVVDLSKLVKTTQPSFYNYSDVFYKIDKEPKTIFRRSYGHDDYDPEYFGASQNDNSMKAELVKVNKQTTELLDRKNTAEFEKLFNDFLKISEEYEIDNNLDAKGWTKMVFHPENYEVRYFVKKYKTGKNDIYNPDYSPDYDYANEDVVVDAAAAVDSAAAISEDGRRGPSDSILLKPYNPNIVNEISPAEYFKNNLTDYYYYDKELKQLLINVDDVKTTDFLSENIHIYLWIAFLLSCAIFCYRATGLRTYLFAIISTGVLALVVTLMGVSYSIGFGGATTQFFVSYLLLVLGLIILFLPIFAMEGINKKVSGILINMTISGFVFLIFLILEIISQHQRSACISKQSLGNYSDCKDILDYLGFWTSYLLLGSGLIFLYFYTSIIQKWRALPS